MNTSRIVLLATFAVVVGCVQPLKLSRDDSAVVLARQTIRAPSPGLRGTYAVRTLSYGSGTDRHRPIYRDSVTIRTKSVDGSPFVSASPEIAENREEYWGFDFKHLPLNARVWYPDGTGPFPLVLVVHGNHNMKDFSDPGYAWLGELLASRGIILASVDENFINGNLRGENDGRGWLLLKHLERWRAWNDSAGSPFEGKVDMSRLALMGHSRGGEAVAVAAAFNRLARYPDDANVTFDFNFDLRSIVAIAPVDGQYRPANTPTPVENVNYLVIHGSHDGDVSTFNGLRQYARVAFTDGKPWFKSAVYVYRANHGQWNSVWGNKDRGPRSGRSLNLDALMPEEDQRRFGAVYISAFLEATLHDRREYLPLFRDHRTAGHWLPHTMYITRFEESAFRAVARYESDVDVAHGSAPRVSIRGDSLSTWKEAVVPFRRADSDMGTNAVWLGWNNTAVAPDTAKPRASASYSISITDSLRTAWHVGRGSALVLSVAPTPSKPGPRKSPRDSSKAGRDSSQAKPAPSKAESTKKEPADTLPFDLSIELVDAAGGSVRLPLSRFGVPRRPLDVYIARRRGRDKSSFTTQYELVLQTYVLPIADFAAAARPGTGTNGATRFDPDRIETIRLVFDRTPRGEIVLDDVGFSSMDPAFLMARLNRPAAGMVNSP